MKIGIITDNCSNYHNKYPHLRECQPWIKALVNDGHEVYLLSPSFTKAMWNKFHNGFKHLFQEWFQDRVGILPVLDNTIIDIEKLIVVAVPWINRFNYKVVDEIKKYAKMVNEIIWVVEDYELYAKQPSLLYDIIPKQHLDIKDKITTILTTDFKADTNEIQHYFPLLYDPSYEIPIDYSSKWLLSKFCGPVGFRTAIGNILPYLDDAGADYKLKSIFYGEEYATKYRDNRYNLFDYSFTSIEVVPERIFMPYPDYIKFISNCYITFHDSYIPAWLDGISTKAHWHSGKLTDCAYAGVIPFSSRFYNDEEVYFIDLNANFNEFRVHVDAVMSMTEKEYISFVDHFRISMNNSFGLDVWYPKFKKLIGL